MQTSEATHSAVTKSSGAYMEEETIRHAAVVHELTEEIAYVGVFYRGDVLLFIDVTKSSGAYMEEETVRHAAVVHELTEEIAYVGVFYRGGCYFT